jgi:diguanylate cyclase (GGDEF)-like protein/PAS domain S-box-containing protein
MTPAEPSLVLVIDDDQTLHLWAQRQLLASGFKLVSAYNGSDGIAAFKIHLPAIVLVDIDMPDMDGFAACAAIRGLPEGKSTPVLMVTGTEDADKIASSYSAGATDFVVKPINWKVLIHRLHYMVKASHVLHQLKQSQARLSKAQQMAKLGHWEWSMRTNALYWSDEIFAIFELNRERLSADLLKFLNMIHPEDRHLVEQGFDQAIKKQATVTIEYRIITGLGNASMVEQQIETIKDVHGELTGLTGTLQDITERKHHESQVRQLAYYDVITGLPNRSFFLEQLGKTLATAKRHNHHFALLFLDMDGFKGINDCYGHSFGDLFLQAFAKRLTDGLRRADVGSRYLHNHAYEAEVARLGGDEFTLLLKGIAQAEEAAAVAENVQTWLNEPFLLEGQYIFSGASIGIALYPKDGEDASTLLKNADVAMYHAKKSGKGQYQFFHEAMNQKAEQRHKMESLMHQAVANNELQLFYEPIVCTTSGQVLGAEALLRWQSPQLGFLMPDSFIPLAEDNGLIYAFGEWVIRQACQELHALKQQGMGHLTLSVNVSGVQFSHNGFVAMVASMLEKYPFEPGLLVFEMTESTLMNQSVKMMGILLALKKLGIKLSLDDFGTGYSSLSYLKQFPLDALKIDKSFVKDLPDKSEDAAIVNAILALAHTLNLQAIAEGVETEQQRQFFINNNCLALQGYLFSKPMLMADFKRYWQSHP